MSNLSGFRFSKLVGRNLANRPYRNIATIFAFALIAGTLFSSQFLSNGAEQSLDAGMDRLGADIMVVPDKYLFAGQTVLLTGEPTTFFFEDAGFEEISRIPGVAKASPQMYIATLFASCCAAPVQMIAIDPETDFTISAWLVDNPGVKMGEDDIIIGSNIIQDPGKELMFYGHIFHVVGTLDQTGTGMDNSVFTRFEDAYVMAGESGAKAVKKLNIPREMASAVLVKVEPGMSPEAVADEIERQVPGTRTILPNGLMSAVNGQLAAVTLLLEGSAVAVTVVSIPLLGLVSALVANEQKKDISILRALGATKGFVTWLILAESFALAIIGSIIGIGVATWFLVIYQDFITFSLKIPFIIPSNLTILAEGGGALLLSVAIAGTASIYPVFRITRSEPYEGIGRGVS